MPKKPVGNAAVQDGALVTSFGAYQPRTFALRLAASSTKVPGVQSTPVSLAFNIVASSKDGSPVRSGFDGKGNALPAEMLPSTLSFNDVEFHLANAMSGAPNAVVASGQTVNLPACGFNRVYILAASADGDQKAAFRVGSKTVDLNVQNWGGFIGQWDNRQWTGEDRQIPARGDEPAHTEHDDYAKMTGIQPGYIKRADVAWYSTHHHNAKGENIAYGYSYLFAYALDLPEGAKTITLPHNDKIRVFAISVANENPEIHPVQPLYDTLVRTEK